MPPSITLAQARATAMAFEIAAFRFYSDLAPRLRPEVRSLAKDLAAEELEHYRLLNDLSEDEQLADHRAGGDRRPAAEFTTCTRLRSSRDALEDDLLAYAEARERIAREHYGYLAELAPAGPLRDLFAFLRREEERHAGMLSTRWAILFSIL
jgi:rubrerythrin